MTYNQQPSYPGVTKREVAARAQDAFTRSCPNYTIIPAPGSA